MGFLADFVDLLPDTVSVQVPTSRNAYDEDTYGTATTYQGREVFKDTARRTANATLFVSPSHVLIACDTVIPLDAKVTINGGPARIVASVDTFRDETNAVHHCTVYFAT